MDPASAAGTFATIVGLLADFVAHRSDRKGAELVDFVEWLRGAGHDEIIAAVGANHQTSIGIKAILATNQRDVEEQLRQIDRRLADVCKSFGTFTELARSLYPPVPTDILDHIGPGAPQERVLQILGPAHRVYQDTFWAYRFTEVLIQIEFYKGSGAKSIAIALTEQSPEEGFKLPQGGQLGKITMADAMLATGELRYTNNMRGVQNLQFDERIGPTGAWRHYTYGALDPIATGSLAACEFRWDDEKQELLTDPTTIRLNWFGMSLSSIDEQFFDWTIGIPN